MGQTKFVLKLVKSCNTGKKLGLGLGGGAYLFPLLKNTITQNLFAIYLFFK